MKLSNAMLKNISKQIEYGRAVTAIATANHYLKKDCPVRMALVKKASEHIKCSSQEILCLLAGETLNDTQLLGALSKDFKVRDLKKQPQSIPSKFTFQIQRAQSTRRSSPSRFCIKRNTPGGW